MLWFESVAVAYFAALTGTACLLKPRTVNSWRAAVSSATTAAAILLIVQIAPFAARAWLGHAYLVAGYFIPSLLVAGRQPGAFEAWLVRSEDWWKRWRVPLPRLAAVAVELSYLLCYVLVPAAFLVVFLAGTRADIDRFWTAVLVSGFACYGTLPWLIARPPRAIAAAREAQEGSLHGMNVLVLTRVSHGHNTFPSGHVAVSTAAAVVVCGVVTLAGAALLVISAGIAVGAIAGRYHYTIDVVLGALIGGGAALII